MLMKIYYRVLPYFLHVIVLALFSVTISHTAFASHSMGADITYQCVGANEYLVTLTFFRDCAGIRADTNQVLRYSSVSCGINNSIPMPKSNVVADVTPICPSEMSACAGGASPFGIEQHIYQTTLTLPPGCGNDWVLRWEQCCRNFAITTLNSPQNMDLVVTANLDNTIAQCNNSPVFNNIPTPIVCSGEEVFYNHGVTDPDGDSLAFSLVDCGTTNNGTIIPVTYNPPFSTTSPLATASGVSLNPRTGELRFTPIGMQIGVLCVQVDEYRNGVKIGETMRDMQFSVVNCSNNSPVSGGIDGDTTYTFSICKGTNFCFNIEQTDADGDNIEVSWNEGIPAGIFTVYNNNTSSPNARFCWDTGEDDVGLHFFTVTVEDDACLLRGSRIYTYIINVFETNNTLDAGDDQLICEGESTILNAISSGATTYSWTPSAGLANPNSASTSVTPARTTVYTVAASFNDGCIISDYVTVTISDPPPVNASPTSAYICPGSSATLIANAPTATNYFWSTGATTPSISVTPNATQDYWVSVVDANGCTNSDTATIRVNEPDSNGCVVVYATPTGTGDGTQANPASLVNAITLATCNDMIVKLDTGTYTIDNAITNLAGGVTIEGGFVAADNWKKISRAGGSRIFRSTANPETNPDRLTAIYISDAQNFRFQDVTIEVADVSALAAGTSTYGVHLTNCSDYSFVRCQIIAGNAADGADGQTPATVSEMGTDGGDGMNGTNNDDDEEHHGGAGGLGGGIGGGAQGWDGTNGCTQPDGLNVGCDGLDGGASTNFWAGGGGGGGGGGGQEERDGGVGGAGGAVVGLCAAVSLANNQPGTGSLLRPCRSTGPWAGQENDCHNLIFNGSLDRTSDRSGRCGRDGNDGCDGANGNDGPVGFHNGVFFIPGAQGGNGERGFGGQGGSGGGGGAGEGFPGIFGCGDDDGSGSSGGGGGGGGEGGYGGTGGTGGGSSFGLYLINSTTNASFLDCNIQAGLAGIGGVGGQGSEGAFGGRGGDGGGGFSEEVGLGGNGGFGGRGGQGGNGGNGADGESLAIFSNTPISYTPFDLQAQPEITMENISCVNQDMDFSAAVANNWDLGTDATPQTVNTVATATTQYASTGRKDITYSTDTYTGFANIVLPDNPVPEGAASALLINNEYHICAGETVDFEALNGGFGYIYNWDMGGGSTPNTYAGTDAQSLTAVPFDTPGTYEILLQYQTDCCGLSEMDTLILVVEEQPVAAIVGDTAYCAGSEGVILSGSGGMSYTWAPDIGISNTQGDSILARPDSNRTYFLTATNASGLCSDVAQAEIVVNDFELTATPVSATCGPDGAAMVTPTGGSGMYTYLWNTSPPQTIDEAINLEAGSHQVIVTDDVTGCVDSLSVFVNAAPANLLVGVRELIPVSCPGGTDGIARLSVQGGTGPYTYSWKGGISNTDFIIGVGAGVYEFTITDQGTMCSVTDSLEIPEPSPVGIDVLDVDTSTCSNFGRIEVNAFGGNGPFTFAWSDSTLGTTNVADSLLPNTPYSLIIADEKGCADTLDFTIPGPESPVSLVALEAIPPTFCGLGDGRAAVQASGGDGNYIYSWDHDPMATDSILDSLAEGAYLATVIDGNGCSATVPVDLTNCPLPIELLEFIATPEESSIRLDWQTANEQNNFGFEVERSRDSSLFKKIGWVDALGTSDGAYEFNDQDVEPDSRYYYRLKQMDFDGAFHYSDIRSAIIHTNDLIKLLGVYPVPSSDKVFIDIQIPQHAQIKIFLTNTLGQVISVYDFDGKSGLNHLEMNLKDLASGVYYAKIRLDEGYERDVKVVKRD